MQGDIALSGVIGALSYALDITEGRPEGHALRSCAIGMRIAQELARPGAVRSDLFYALLLKDAGCSANAERMAALFGADDPAAKRTSKLVDWSSRWQATRWSLRTVAPQGSLRERVARLQGIRDEGEATRKLMEARCDRGAEIARMLYLSEETAAAIRSLDEHWDGRGHPDGLAGEEIPLLARVLCLAQTPEIFHAAGGVKAARTVAVRRRGRWFDPAVVDAFLATCRDRGFWASLGEADVSHWEPADLVLRADAPIADLAANHHERIDGTGYPRGLAGEALDLPVRALAMADVYEALTADRPYRGPLPEDKALDIVSWEVPGRLDRTAFAALEAWLGRSTEPVADPLAPRCPHREHRRAPRVPHPPELERGAPGARDPSSRPTFRRVPRLKPKNGFPIPQGGSSSMSSTTRRVAALVGAGILLVPAVAGAKPGPKHEKPAKPVKLATYVFKGVWHADGTVTVSGGNAKVRKGGYVAQVVAFDVAAAKLRVADTNADAAVTVADLVEGDKVVIQAKLPRTAPAADAAAAPIVARKVVDQTHPVVEVEEPAPVVEAPAPEAPVAP